MELSDCGPAITDEQIAGFEAQLKVRLPTQYRQFLLETNGGVPNHPTIVWLHPSGQESGTTLATFFSLGGKEDLRLAWQNCRLVIPDDWLAIAEDIAGNLLCLQVAGQNHGSVFFWDHELSSDELEDEFPAYSSFDKLVKQLKIPKIEEKVSPYAPLIQEIWQNDDTARLEKALDMGMDVNYVNPNTGVLLVEDAVIGSQTRIFALLYHRGASPERAREFATRLNRVEILKVLES